MYCTNSITQIQLNVVHLTITMPERWKHFQGYCQVTGMFQVHVIKHLWCEVGVKVTVESRGGEWSKQWYFSLPLSLSLSASAS